MSLCRFQTPCALSTGDCRGCGAASCASRGTCGLPAASAWAGSTKVEDVERLLAGDGGAYVELRGVHGFIRLADDDAWLALNRCSLADYKPDTYVRKRRCDWSDSVRKYYEQELASRVPRGVSISMDDLRKRCLSPDGQARRNARARSVNAKRRKLAAMRGASR